MRKILKEFDKPGFWEQSLEWYSRQEAMRKWIDENVGKPEDLIGGEWI